jgi:DNA-binding ferritin-like protein
MNVKRQKRQPIVAESTLSKLTNFLKNISEKLFNLFDKLGESGMKIVGQKDLPDGGQWLKLDYNGKTAEVTISPIDGKEGHFSVVIQSSFGGKTTLDDVSESDIDSKIDDVLKKIFNGTSNVKSSKSLKVTLQTINSTTGVDVNLTAIKANYDPGKAVQDLETVLGDDAFIAQLSSEPVSFEIIDEGDSYDIQQTDSFDTCGTINQLIQSAMQLWANLKVINWAAKGTGYFELRSRSSDLLWRISSEIDVFGEYAVEVKQPAPNPLSTCCNLSLITDQGGFTVDQGYALVRDEIKTYVSVLETLYVNFPHDVQNLLDEMIRLWKKDSEYFYTRVLM